MTQPRHGEPVPWFEAQTTHNPTFRFHTVGGAYVVLCCFGSLANPASRRIVEDFKTAREHLDRDSSVILGVSVDPNDRKTPLYSDGDAFITFWDFDRRVSQLYGLLAPAAPESGAQARYRPCTFILDPTLRVLEIVPFTTPETHVQQVVDYLAGLPALGTEQPAGAQAPMLVVPRVFEPELCRTLIDYYGTHEPTDSGFMREVDGKTVEVLDHNFKRRQDCSIDDPGLRDTCRLRVVQRLVPEIAKVYQFRATRIERYIVACYDSTSGGYFRPHRDNTTKGTAHRRFAVTINLNAEDYDGGDLCFPEYGRQLFRAPTGGAVVFSCSVLHEARPITSGTRYCFLPFLYDDAAAKLREQNLKYVARREPAPKQPAQDTDTADDGEVRP